VAVSTPSPTALVRRACRLNRELAHLYPDAHIELNFVSPLELLVAAILSVQTTDRKVNEVTRVLFTRYRTATDYAAADQAELEKVIAPTGYFRAKAKTCGLTPLITCLIVLSLPAASSPWSTSSRPNVSWAASRSW